MLRMMILITTMLSLAPTVRLQRPVAAAGEPSLRRVSVTLHPDQAGANGFSESGCDACDGRFDGAEARLGNLAPLPSVAVEIIDPDGRVWARTTSRPQSNGRQSAVFEGRIPTGASLRVSAPSKGWQLCDGAKRVLLEPSRVSADGTLRLSLGLWRGCASDAVQRADVAGGSRPRRLTRAEMPRRLSSRHQNNPGMNDTLVAATGSSGGSEPSASHVLAAGRDASNAATTELAVGAMKTSPVAKHAPQVGAAKVGAESSGSVDGHVFDDVDGDGLFGAGETGLPGVRVRLEEVGEGRGSASRSSAGGRFAFGAVPAGRYSVAVEPPSGYRVSTTERFAQVLVGKGTTAVALDFGLRPVAAPERAADRADRSKGAGRQLVPRLPATGLHPFSHGSLMLGVAALMSLIGISGLAALCSGLGSPDHAWKGR